MDGENAGKTTRVKIKQQWYTWYFRMIAVTKKNEFSVTLRLYRLLNYPWCPIGNSQILFCVFETRYTFRKTSVGSSGSKTDSVWRWVQWLQPASSLTSLCGGKDKECKGATPKVEQHGGLVVSPRLEFWPETASAWSLHVLSVLAWVSYHTAKTYWQVHWFLPKLALICSCMYLGMWDRGLRL